MVQTPTLQFPDSRALRAHLRDQAGPRILLAFSRGKDALAAWVALTEEGFDVVCYHLDVIPDLGFVNESIAYFERKLKTKIIRLPHPQFFRMLDAGVFQPPERRRILDEHIRRDPPTYPDIQAYLRSLPGNDKAWVATGVRASDNTVRRTNIARNGPVNLRERLAYAVYDWKIADVRAALARHTIELPVDYELWGRTFDGIHLQYLAPLRERFPADYQKVVEWFPLVELEFIREEFAVALPDAVSEKRRPKKARRRIQAPAQ